MTMPSAAMKVAATAPNNSSVVNSTTNDGTVVPRSSAMRQRRANTDARTAATIAPRTAATDTV